MRTAGTLVRTIRSKVRIPEPRSARAYPGWLVLLLLAVLCAGPALSAFGAPVPPPEKLLPNDTLLFVTVPDCTKLSDIFKKSPSAQLWSDSAMKPFKDKFMAKWNQELVAPLERELDIKLDDYLSLLQGQLTLAILRNGWQGAQENAPSVVLLLDTKDKSSQLQKNLESLRKKWVDAKRTMRTEKVRGVEFTIIPTSGQETPQALRKLLPGSSGDDDAPSAASSSAKSQKNKNELVIGQADSLLIVTDTPKSADKILARLAGGSVPPLSDLAAYQADHAALFRSAPLYGWVNAKAFVDIFMLALTKAQDGGAPSSVSSQLEKVFSALGIYGLKTLAFNYENSLEGDQLQLFAGVPESGRKGIFKLLAGEAKESTPPPFIPADAVKFQRWRLDGKKAWATILKTLTDIDPSLGGYAESLLDSASGAVKDKDPDFDVRKNLIGNLGDDIITFEKAPQGETLSELGSGPSLFLLGSPNAEQLAGTLRMLQSASASENSAPSEREFLGRKIYTLPMSPSLLGSVGVSTLGGASSISYAASGGYVVFSANATMIEDYLRASESRGKSLRETTGLTDAAQKVAGPGAWMFGFENQAETMRSLFATLKKLSSGGNTEALGRLTAGLGLPISATKLGEWVDLKMLPNYDQISKDFSFTVYGAGADVNGLSLKIFSPTPPQIRSASSR